MGKAVKEITELDLDLTHATGIASGLLRAERYLIGEAALAFATHNDANAKILRSKADYIHQEVETAELQADKLRKQLHEN